MKIENILIIGKGQMGTGISRLLMRNHISCELIGEREFMSDKFSLATLSMKPDLVIESVREDFVIKSRVIQKISRLLFDVVIASGTSSLSINNLSVNCLRPELFCGLHFMNPPLSINFVELVTSNSTSKDVSDLILKWLKSFDRKVVELSDTPGFLLNALLFPLINRSIYLFDQTDLKPAEIDNALKIVCGHKLGPLETADLVGLDTVLSILTTLHEAEPLLNLKPPSILANLVAQGILGKKSKKGFYEYS